jgi:hypothetical protein
MTSLERWADFYVIVGSAAAALTGLMFVATALIADFEGNERQIQAFGTPTVVHFCAVLLQAAILTAPWPTTTGVRVALGLHGASGVVYMVVVMRRARQQTGYEPYFEDWLFHGVLPFVAYAGVVTAASLLSRWQTPVLFVIGGTALLLLFVGIHNAWDTVTYILVMRWERSRRDKGPSPDSTNEVPESRDAQSS